jgi:hypothetical protein
MHLPARACTRIGSLRVIVWTFGRSTGQGVLLTRKWTRPLAGSQVRCGASALRGFVDRGADGLAEYCALDIAAGSEFEHADLHVVVAAECCCG